MLLLVGQLALLGPAGQAADDDPGQANAHAEQDRRAGGCPRHAFKLTAEERRHERAERRAIAQGHRHPQGNAQVSHGQTEGQAADPPEDAEQIAPEQGRPRCLAENPHRSGIWTRANSHGANTQLKTPPTSQYDSHDQPLTPRNGR